MGLTSKGHTQLTSNLLQITSADLFFFFHAPKSLIIIIYWYSLHRSVFESCPAKIMYNTVTIRYNTIRYDTLRYVTMRCDGIQCDTLRCDTFLSMQFFTVSFFRKVLNPSINQFSLYKTSRLHFSVRVYCNRSQKTSQCVKQNSRHSISSRTFCSLHAVTSSVIYYSTHTRKNVMSLRLTLPLHLYVLLSHQVHFLIT